MLIVFLWLITVFFVGGYSFWAIRFWRMGYKSLGVLAFSAGLLLSACAWMNFL